MSSFLNSLLHPLLSLHGWEAYLLVGALCFGEAAIFLGFVLPGETAVVLGGVLASMHHVNLVAMIVLVVVTAIIGDTVGYEVGRHLGPVLLKHRPLKGNRGVEASRRLIERRGGPAVFLGRFTALFRAVIPGVAGMSGMRYRTFLAFNALGGLCWGVAYSLGGYFAGKSYEKVLSAAGSASTGILIAAGVAIVGFLVWRRLSDRRRLDRPPPPSDPEAPSEPAPGEQSTEHDRTRSEIPE